MSGVPTPNTPYVNGLLTYGGGRLKLAGVDEREVDQALAALAGLVGGDGEPGGGVRSGLRMLGPARERLDGIEGGLIAAARAGGLSWRSVAAELGLGSGQAAEQRALRLAGAGSPGGRSDVAGQRHRRAVGQGRDDGDAGQPVGDGDRDDGDRGTAPAAAPPAHADEGLNSSLTSVAGGAGPGSTARSGTAESPAAAGGQAAVESGYDLVATGEAGVWAVLVGGVRVGTVRRERSPTGRSTRWQAWSQTPYMRISAPRTWSSRAQAAAAVLDQQRRRAQQRSPRRRRRTR